MPAAAMSRRIETAASFDLLVLLDARRNVRSFFSLELHAQGPLPCQSHLGEGLAPQIGSEADSGPENSRV